MAFSAFSVNNDAIISSLRTFVLYHKNDLKSMRNYHVKGILSRVQNKNQQNTSAVKSQPQKKRMLFSWGPSAKIHQGQHKILPKQI